MEAITTIINNIPSMVLTSLGLVIAGYITGKIFLQQQLNSNFKELFAVIRFARGEKAIKETPFTVVGSPDFSEYLFLNDFKFERFNDLDPGSGIRRHKGFVVIGANQFKEEQIAEFIRTVTVKGLVLFCSGRLNLNIINPGKIQCICANNQLTLAQHAMSMNRHLHMLNRAK